MDKRMTAINVYSEYYTVWGSTEEIELPKGKSSKDIKEIYLKRSCGHIVFKDGTTLDFTEEIPDEIDAFKEPKRIFCTAIDFGENHSDDITDPKLAKLIGGWDFKEESK